MLAEIVMGDLERSVFERLGFVLPFYFRYVDDNLFYVPPARKLVFTLQLRVA